MTNAFLGQISLFGGNFAPKNTALCNGQTLSIQQNAALFSLLGTFYGGNGVNTFMLPNLQSQVPIHQGQGVGLSPYNIGQTAGSATVGLNQNNFPVHLHTLNATKTASDSNTIASNKLPGPASGGSNPLFYATPRPSPTLVPTPMAAGACSTIGNNVPHGNLMPSLCVSFFIYLSGIFPSRN